MDISTDNIDQSCVLYDVLVPDGLEAEGCDDYRK